MATIKNSMVTREAYDIEHDSVTRKLAQIAMKDAEIAALRRESGKRRDLIAGLVVFSAVQALAIWAMILEYIIF